MTLRLLPITLREANELVERLHRHHVPTMGHRFSIGVATDDGVLRGAVIVGRPVARALDYHAVAEVTRLVTDGTPNACSILYAAAARACRAMGYRKVQTYILASEPGTSLQAAGWINEGLTSQHHRQWTGTNGKARRTDQPTEPKQRWSITWGPA